MNIIKTDVAALNDVLRAHGNVDTYRGKFALFSEITVKNNRVDGYVKPLFQDVGWIVTELPRDSVSGLGLPAFFHSLAWDAAQKDLLLTLVPESLVPMTSIHCVLITGVIGIHVCPSSVRPLGRLISFETEKGKTSIIRLELHLGQRSTYQRYHESCFKQAFVHDL